MHAFTSPGALSLLRLIVELKGSEMPSNAVYLLIVSEREPARLAAQLAELDAAGLVAWSEAGDQWTPTMRGLVVGLSQPGFEPGELDEDLDAEAHAECA